MDGPSSSSSLQPPSHLLMVEHSVLQPVDPSTLPDFEREEAAPWIIRKLVGSLMGRIVMASYETLRATGTSIVCLSPWGDSSPLFLPCIRFRDLVVHSVIVATGGAAAFVTPAFAPLADAVASSSFASSIVVEVVGVASHEAIVKGGDWLLVDKPLDLLLPKYSVKLQTTSVKVVMIDIKYKHLIDDAALGFFRSPEHKDPSLISNVGDYFAVEKGWFSPYLFATARRPIIPRTMKADIVFAHGPFLTGDYQVAETLLAESSMALHFCVPPPPREKPPDNNLPITDAINTARTKISSALSPDQKPGGGHSMSDTISTARSKLTATWLPDQKRSRTPSPDPPPGTGSAGSKLEDGYKRLSGRFFGASDAKNPQAQTDASNPAASTSLPPVLALPDGIDATDVNPLSKVPPPPRRMVILLLGIKPHRGGMWTTSQRPSESVIQYLLLDGCPAIVVPVKPGSPLVAWDTLTLAQLQKYPKDGRGSGGIVRILFEYVSLCVDWERVVIAKQDAETGGEKQGAEKEKDATGEGNSKGEEGDDIVQLTKEADDLDGSKRKTVRHALELLIESAMKSGDSKEVKDKVDPDRAGIVMFRLP